jgi:hypothetical protein
MKILKAANGKETIKINKSEWESLGKTAGWMNDEIIPSQIVTNLMNGILDYFGTGKVKTGSSYDSYEMMDETMGTCWIDVSYIERDKVIHVEKYYENELMNDSLGASLQVPFSTNEEELKKNVIGAIERLRK